MDPVFFFKSSAWSSEDKQGWRWWLRVWTPVVIAVLVICAESTDFFSSQNTSSALRPILERWFGAFTDRSEGCVPIFDHFHDEKIGGVTTQFFDVVLGIGDPNVFIPNQACPHVATKPARKH